MELRIGEEERPGRGAAAVARDRAPWGGESLGDQVFEAAGPLCVVGPDFRILLANGAFLRLVGREREEVLAFPCRTVLENSLCGTSGCPLLAVREGEEKRTCGIAFAGPGGTRECSLTAVPLRGAEGIPAGMIASFTDITALNRTREEKRLVEDKLLQVQKMEAVGRLASGVAHDFNNMLAVVLGYTEMILGDLDERSRLRPMVKEILGAGVRAQEITAQLLTFSRRRPREMKVVDLNAFIGANEKMLRRLAGEERLFQTVLTPAPAFVLADGSQILQVLMNLVANARDAMGEGGKILIETSVSGACCGMDPGLPGSGNENYVLLAVSDTGHGMDEETARFVFDPFFTTKKETEGTGLGLCTVREIVERHGGAITLSSAPGCGTTFTIRLPRVEAEPGEAGRPSARTPNSPGGDETVLLVESDGMVRRLAREILARSGYSVIEAATPDDAIRLEEDHDGPIHLLLAETSLPLMRGDELHRFLSLRRPELKVLYMQGSPLKEASGRPVAEEGASLLEKPFTLLELARAVRAVLDGRGFSHAD